MNPEKTGEIAKNAEKIFLCVLCVLGGFFFVGVSACTDRKVASKPTARNLVLITIDTLRADHVGAYGWTRARTPALDALAKNGALFERAFAAAPITLPSHATLLTGRYPPGHGARDNGLHVSATVPTLATELHAKGFATAAFVAAFPLDHQFGLNRGFDVYGDTLPRGPDGRPANERPAAAVVNDAIAWLYTPGPKGPGLHALDLPAPPGPPALPGQPFFLWVHVFEPHAPYGDPSGSSRSALERYDEEIATADREIGRLIAALGPAAAQTLVVAAGDHGEAFGEHDEYAHSIFVYDTTLRVPLLMSGPGISAATRVAEPVTLADVAPTAMRALGMQLADVDGIDLSPAFSRAALPQRELYAESFAPLVEFGWAPLRALRTAGRKLIAAPAPELFDIEQDPAETKNLAGTQSNDVQALQARVNRYSGPDLPSPAAADREAAERLRALGYSSASVGSQQAQSAGRPDPKDRRTMAARIAQITSGELSGTALLEALEGIVRDDPRNGQAQLRLGYARLQAGDCARAEPAFHAAAAAGLPSADVHLGLATCLGRRGDLGGAERALTEARRIEPGNPAVTANLGLLQASKGDFPAAIQSLSAALAADPEMHEARFNLAVVYAKAGRRADAAATARDLLARLPPSAPQRGEVERLLRAVR
jgi:arylsulfatase A-like enzyme/cytochrome c-type biogenesis protein CcmH/NrfG